MFNKSLVVIDNNLWIYILLLGGRFFSFFCISPLFSNKIFPNNIRFGLALGCTLLLIPFLIDSSTTVDFTQLDIKTLFVHKDYLFIFVIKELIIGYLLGFLFALLFEAAAFAGQFLGTLMGFSATELLDPLSNLNLPLMGRFFTLLSFALFLLLDLHHALLRILYHTFKWIPLNGMYLNINFDTLYSFAHSSGIFLQQALDFSFLPSTILCLILLGFVPLSRSISIFWHGFPLQILAGLSLLIWTLQFVPPLLIHAFNQLLDLAKNSIVNF